MKLFITIVVAAVWVVLAGPAAGDWRQFRGNQTTGSADGESLPSDWNEGGDGKIDWRVDLPGRGVSSPIVVGDLVVVTASSGFKHDRLHLLAFD